MIDHLGAGAEQEISFNLKPQDLSMVSEAGQPMIPAGEFQLTVGGSQPDGSTPGTSQAFQVKNAVDLQD